jgi:eukaryotic-like serine/threonine-protein kinase
MAAYMTNLAQVLARGDLLEAEQLVSELLTPELESHPQSAGWLRFRGDLWARTGRWKEAAADFSKLIELEPENHENYHLLAPLLVASGDLDAYRRHCAQVVDRFGKADDPTIAERMAKDCLILPSSGADLDAVDDMIDSALAAGPDYWAASFFQFAKGLSEYRQGHFTSAVEWLQKALAMPGESEFRDAQAYLVLAMVHHQLNHVEEARAAFAEGSAIIETRQPILGSGARGADWNDWLIADALQREATALIERPPTTADELPNE